MNNLIKYNVFFFTMYSISEIYEGICAMCGAAWHDLQMRIEFRLKAQINSFLSYGAVWKGTLLLPILKVKSAIFSSTIFPIAELCELFKKVRNICFSEKFACIILKLAYLFGEE